MSRDIHQALKTEVIKETNGGGCNFALVQMQWGKTDKALGLHANPTTWSTAGFQRTDFLRLLGFQRGRCPFMIGGECYSQFVQTNFDLDRFSGMFDQAYQQLSGADRDLEACGYPLPQPEGWGYFFGDSSGSASRMPVGSGDGHTAATTKELKTSEDETFHCNCLPLWVDQGDGGVVGSTKD